MWMLLDDKKRPKSYQNDQNTSLNLQMTKITSKLLLILEVLDIFGPFKSLGHFGHSNGFRVFLVILEVLEVFLSFYRLQGILVSL